MDVGHVILCCLCPSPLCVLVALNRKAAVVTGWTRARVCLEHSEPHQGQPCLCDCEQQAEVDTDGDSEGGWHFYEREKQALAPSLNFRFTLHLFSQAEWTHSLSGAITSCLTASPTPGLREERTTTQGETYTCFFQPDILAQNLWFIHKPSLQLNQAISANCAESLFICIFGEFDIYALFKIWDDLKK